MSSEQPEVDGERHLSEEVDGEVDGEVDSERRLRLLRIRNPFGDDKEWKLDWSDKLVYLE